MQAAISGRANISPLPTHSGERREVQVGAWVGDTHNTHPRPVFPSVKSHHLKGRKKPADLCDCFQALNFPILWG